MRNYAGRLAKLERALLPQDNELHIQIVYVDQWPNGDVVDPPPNVKRLTWGDEPPIARVAPGLLEKLRDSQLEAIVTATGGDVAELYRTDDTANPPAPALAVSSTPGAADRQPARAAAPGEPPPWNYETARWMYRDPPAGPNLRRMRAMARKAAKADERRR